MRSAGQPRTALHPDSGIREAILNNILLAIGCDHHQQQQQDVTCRSSRVHLFFALANDTPLQREGCGQGTGLSGGDACSVQDFVSFFDKESVKGVFLQDMMRPAKMVMLLRLALNSLHFACQTHAGSSHYVRWSGRARGTLYPRQIMQHFALQQYFLAPFFSVSMSSVLSVVALRQNDPSCRR